ASLLAQTQALQQLAIAVTVRALQIIEQLAAAADETEQAAARVEILDVRLEVLGQFVDPCGQQRDLHFRRTGVALGALVRTDQLRLLFGGNGHYLTRLISRKT